MAIAVALLIVCSQITVPLPGVPFTLQTFAVGLVASLLLPLDAFIACLVYLLLGVIGLPVFAGGGGGWASFIGAGGGFLLGFAAFTLLTSSLIAKHHNFWYLLFSLILGDALAFFCGWLGLMAFLHLNASAAFYAGVAPFILVDLIKMVIVAIIARRLRPIIAR